MEILQTRKLEDAARELAGRYDRVLVRNKNMLWNPIRLRRSRLQDLKPLIVMNAPAFNAELAAWNREGGMLIYDRGYMKNEDIATHHAQLISECPLSVDYLHMLLDATREMGVVYRPPNWDEHFRCIGELYPTSERCRALHAIVAAAPEREDLRVALKLPAGFHALSDERAMATLNLNGTQLWKTRSALFRKRDYRMVTEVVPRVPPPERTLSQVYAFIVQNIPAVAGVHLILGNALSKATRYWHQALRDLARCGSIDLRETIYCYYLEEEFEPHWFKVDAEHARARKRLEEVIGYVEALPEFIPPAAPHLQSPLRPSALSRLKSSPA